MGYEIDKSLTLPFDSGSGSKTEKNLYIIAHETAMENVDGKTVVQSLINNIQKNQAYTTYLVGDGKVYQMYEPGYVSWGALSANNYAPVQIEFEHTTDKQKFKKNYEIYIALIRDSAKKYGIPLTLDEGGKGTPGVKSHFWVSQNIEGDHVDPYGYLETMGITKEQFSKDIASGISNGDSSGGTKPPKEPDQPEKPSEDNASNKNEDLDEILMMSSVLDNIYMNSGTIL